MLQQVSLPTRVKVSFVFGAIIGLKHPYEIMVVVVQLVCDVPELIAIMG